MIALLTHWPSFTQWAWLLLLPPIYAFLLYQHRHTITDLQPAKKRLALAARVVLVTLLVLALAGLRLVRRRNSLLVVFLADASASIRPDQRARMESYLKQAVKAMRPSDRAALVTFAAEAHEQSAPGEPLDPSRVTETGLTSSTNIEQALRYGRTIADSAGSTSAKRVVVISDGDENVGRALAEAPELASDHILIDTVTLPDALHREALVDHVVAPARAKIGEPFQVRVVVASLTPQTGTVSLTRDRTPIGSRQVSLHAGKNVVTFDDHVEERGFARYSATLTVPADTIPENNRGEAYVSIEGKPTILYVADSPAMTGFLRKTLQADNIDVDYAPPAALPATPAALQRFDSVFLSNVSAADLTDTQMAALQVACHDFGVGLGMVGGDQSFGAGYWRGTPVEEALPVSMDVKKQKRLPSVAVALVIEDLEIPSTVNMSIEAAKSVIDLLEPIDEVGVLDCAGYGFGGGDPTAASAAGTWRIPMQHVTDPAGLKAAMQNLTDMGDPPTYVPYLLEAARVLNGTDAKVKHIVFLGDGDAIYEASQGDVKSAIGRIRSLGITLSTIASGADSAGERFMAAVAAAGGGQAYVADQPEQLPRLLLKDEVTFSQPPIIEEPFHPAPTGQSDILKGLDWSSAPPLLGYDVVSLKPTASLELIDPAPQRMDPVYATWRYGLGKSVAFMSDDRARWAAQWLDWPGYAKFWAQTVRWTVRSFNPTGYESTVTMDGARGHIEVNALDSTGHYVNGLHIRALVAPPRFQAIHGSKTMEEPIRQTGPGRYEGWFDAPETGTYLVNLLAKSGNGPEHSDTLSLTTAYPPEYGQIRPNTYLMTQLAEAGSGRVDPPPQDIYGADRPAVYTSSDVRPLLLLLAALLLPIDVAIRRLAIDPAGVRRALARLRSRSPMRNRRPELTRLQERKEQALAAMVVEENPAASQPVWGRVAERTAQVPAATQRPLAAAASEGSAEPFEVRAPEPEQEAPEAGTAGMSRLLAAKARARAEVSPAVSVPDDGVEK